ncbi:hypothetical protein BFJ63_vAg19142, partial [Fusarium oxysporum f. sp. narcissi]
RGYPALPQWTISRRLSGQASRNGRIQAHQRIQKSQEETLIRWVLRQESLGYAPSHSQLRACVEAILQQQGDNKPLGKHWTTRFIKRHPKLSTKIGKRQEAARFDGFTPKAIKPENTVNVDEGGIMVGFGLDSLVIGSSDPKKKAMLKGVQSRTWTSFIEAVTATGRSLRPGIIFKGKELQKQWFLNEFELIADWHYITSPNGWTDNHIALEWLKDVYLPQTEPRDASDARLIILDGHGSHAQDEWMATCFLNNVYCCYLPAHCSHGLQPLDNGIFNVINGVYRKELQMLASLTDSAPVDKVNFIRAYAKAREVGMRKDIILSGWRFTGNWPINRYKALTHPEIQPDKEKLLEEFKTPSPPQLHSDDTPKTSRQVREMAKHRSRPTRRKYSKIAKGLEALEMKVAVQNARITGLEEQMAQLRRGKKRKAVPNPNRRFMALSENLAAGEALPDSKEAEIEMVVDEEVESVIEVGVRWGYALGGPGWYNAKLMASQTFCAKFEEAAQQFVTGPQRRFAQQFADDFLGFWKRELSCSGSATPKPTYSSVAAAAPPTDHDRLTHRQQQQQHGRRQTDPPHRQGQQTTIAPPRQDLRVFIRLEAGAPARAHSSYAIRTLIREKLGAVSDKIRQVFQVRSGWAVLAADSATRDFLVEKQAEWA